MEKIILKTRDGVEIVGDYNEISDFKAVAVLLHMMPATRESWNGFSSELAESEFSSLAIDLRGHGESQGGHEGYKQFTDVDHQRSILDVEAAISFLMDKGTPFEKIFLAGASIGANLALQYQTEHPEIKATILLSPGTDYKGIMGAELAKKLKNDQAIFVIGSEKDCGYKGGCAGEMAEKISQTAPVANKTVKIFNTSAHGTTLFLKYPELSTEIIKWLESVYKK